MASKDSGAAMPQPDMRVNVQRVPLVPSPAEVSVARSALRGIRASCHAVSKGNVLISANGIGPVFEQHVYPLEFYLDMIKREAEEGLRALGEDPDKVIARNVFGIE